MTGQPQSPRSGDQDVLRDYGGGLVIRSTRNRHDRRFRMIEVWDEDQILREFTTSDQSLDRAIWFAQGYKMARAVYDRCPPSARGDALADKRPSGE